jgi:hypothetical protein
MGIQGLTKLIADNAPQAIKENQINNYFGRKIAVDASMTLYQFLIAVRPDDTNSFTLTNESGETTRCGHMDWNPIPRKYLAKLCLITSPLLSCIQPSRGIILSYYSYD